MKIERIELSAFELPGVTRRLSLELRPSIGRPRWRQVPGPAPRETVHVLHVVTDEGVEGISTVGDSRHTEMRPAELEQLRLLALGEDPLARERLWSKLRRATRHIHAPAGWFGAFDNCLWDIAGKLAGLPVFALLGRAREAAPAYYNFFGSTIDECVADAQRAIDAGFRALKDHFRTDADTNIAWLTRIRDSAGSDIELLHDAAGAEYSFRDALRVGRTLEKLGYGWFEEPLPDNDLAGLKRLAATLDIPILAPETLMLDGELTAQWLIDGAVDLLRANARYGTTLVQKLAHLAELHGSGIELNGPGGLFGLIHAHLCCAFPATNYYEFFPGGSRDLRGKEIGLVNPPMPSGGMVRPPDAPGWGAEWDRAYFEKVRVGVL